MGFVVEDFADAESALTAIMGHPPDCLVLDYQLPGMTGMDLLEKLRQRGVNTPALIVTANGQNIEARAARAGALAVLRKPLGAGTLSHWLKKVLSEKK
jgi:two-component system CheB/CheR fusion protein